MKKKSILFFLFFLLISVVYPLVINYAKDRVSSGLFDLIIFIYAALIVLVTIIYIIKIIKEK